MTGKKPPLNVLKLIADAIARKPKKKAPATLAQRINRRKTGRK